MANAEHTRDHDTYTAGTSSTRIGALAGRYGLVIVIGWFGTMKFTFYEAQGISPLLANSPCRAARDVGSVIVTTGVPLSS